MRTPTVAVDQLLGTAALSPTYALPRSDLSAQECVDHLILAALDGGGSDNVTVILVRNR